MRRWFIIRAASIAVAAVAAAAFARLRILGIGALPIVIVHALRSSMLLALLTACTASPSQQPPPPLSLAEMKAQLLAVRNKTFRDPASIRDAQIGYPYNCTWYSADSCVCLVSNSKNGFGGYGGLTQDIGRVNRDGSVTIEPAENVDHCQPLTAWPEFNGR